MTFIKAAVSAIIAGALSLLLIITAAIGLIVIYDAQPKPQVQEQPPQKIGLLQYIIFLSPIIDGFKEEMTNLGYVEGKDIIYTEKELALEFSEISQAAKNIVDQNPDLILAVSSVAARAALQETANIPHAADTPIVFSHAFSAVEGQGSFVQSYKSSGNNSTGIEVSFGELTAKKLDFLKRIDPTIQKIAILEPLHKDAIDFPTTLVLPELKKAASIFGTELVTLQIHNPPGEAGNTEIQQLLDSLRPNSIDAYFHIPSHITDTPDNVNRSLEMIERLRIPSVWTNQVQVRDLGGLLTVEEDLHAMGKQSARIAHKILQGAKPTNIPIEAGTSQNLYINTATADRFGIPIPIDILNITNTN